MDLMTTRLMQIKKRNIRRVALVEEPTLRFLDSCSSVYELAHIAIGTDTKLSEVARQRAQPETVDYDPIDAGRSEWRLLPTMDHPDDSARCVLAGTGLTHLGSARGRQSMHANTDSELTDSMKMFHWGVEGGRPAPGCIGTLRRVSTRARAARYARTEKPSTSRRVPRMAAKKLRSPASTW